MILKKLLLSLLALTFFSCGTNTAIVNSWSDPTTTIEQQHFKKILVVALVKDEATRRVTENRISSSNPVFVTSFQYLNGTNLDLSKEQKLKILKDENFDGVLTMRLVSKEKETNYVPGTNTSLFYGGFNGMYSGMYGYGFGNWYGMYSPNFYTPGYYQENTYYMVETNIFSLNQNKLIWTGTTKSSNASDLGLKVDEIMKTLYGQMIKDKTVIKK